MITLISFISIFYCIKFHRKNWCSLITQKSKVRRDNKMLCFKDLAKNAMAALPSEIKIQRDQGHWEGRISLPSGREGGGVSQIEHMPLIKRITWYLLKISSSCAADCRRHCWMWFQLELLLARPAAPASSCCSSLITAVNGIVASGKSSA